jgi:SAM-dependent methyltransferase
LKFVLTVGWAYQMPKILSHQEIKTYVREVYARLAASGTANVSHAPIASGEDLAHALGYDTSGLSISKKAWNLFAGCGNPLQEIELEPHWTVIDLGCGVGIDSQVAALSLQPPGRVIGIDITVALLRQAKEYAGAHPGCHWIAGDAEQLPLQSANVDLVITNGSFNLMPHKEQALAEICRILRPGGYLALADLIVVGEMEPITEGFEDAWSWCVAGALSAGEYEVLLKSKGFSWWELKERGNYGPLAAAHVLARKGGKE